MGLVAIIVGACLLFLNINHAQCKNNGIAIMLNIVNGIWLKYISMIEIGVKINEKIKSFWQIAKIEKR